MSVEEPSLPVSAPEAKTILLGFQGKDIPSAAVIQACVHCGLCLPVCPTYLETGRETSSPRGRILLIKAVSEGQIGLDSAVFQREMSLCLDCRACEVVCPNGVRYGRLLEASREQLERFKTQFKPRPWWQKLLRKVVFEELFAKPLLFQMFSQLLAIYQKSGFQQLARQSGLLQSLKVQEAEALLPIFSEDFLVPKGQIYPAEGKRRFTVALLTGCVMSTAFAQVHKATIRVLQKNGCEVILPPDQTCCGALHFHSGLLEEGRALAKQNIITFTGLGVDAIIVNAAGCGSTLKEYGHLLADDPLWQARAKSFTAKVKDIHEFLGEIDLNRADLGHLPLIVTYQEPCHLAHAQRLTSQPRALLTAIPGLTLREMPESSVCCGSAGVYNLLQPVMAQQLGQRKVRHALATGANVIATANPGCALQLAAELKRQGQTVQIHYIVELLAEAYQSGQKQG